MVEPADSEAVVTVKLEGCDWCCSRAETAVGVVRRCNHLLL